MKVRLMALCAFGLAVVAAAACSSPTAPVPTVPGAPSTSRPAANATIAPTGIAKEEAIAIARKAAPMWIRGDVLAATNGRFGDLAEPAAPVRVSPAPPPDREVWRISLGFVGGPVDAAGADVIVDAADGTVLELWEWVPRT